MVPDDISAPPPALAFSRADSDAANEAWGANCGPHSLAAALGLTLAQVRPHLGAFRGWMSPTMIARALASLGAPYRLRQGLRTSTLCPGISRVQWEGPWLDPGVPPAAAYAHTHWVAHVGGWVLCSVVDPSGWVAIADWGNALRRENRRWHITHHYVMWSDTR